MNDVTRVLAAASQGDPTAAQELLPLVYDELRRLAAHRMAQESPNHTLQPTALVHEAWLRLVRDDDRHWNGRAHFFGAAAEAMRRILIENARRKRALRRGGPQSRIDLEQVEITAELKDDDLLVLDEALQKFTDVDPQKAQLVKLRFFVGLTLEEAAETLGISFAAAKRQWTYSRAWLYREIQSKR